jgi:peptidoglycan/xylan/chitin deacetylase (PgdA/CDA1 family)
MSLLGQIAHPVIELLVKLGVFDTVRLLFPNTLTVLNYHRIDDPHRPGFDTFKLNVSATPGEFANQMDYVKKNYNVISCQQLASFLRGEAVLPPRAAMITFDDGYYDNLSNAFPVLRERNLPAVIFLTTSFIGTDSPFYWDYVACCFHHTKMTSADLPLIGECSWSDERSRYSAMVRWMETIKRIPEVEKIELIQKIGDILKVNPSAGMFANLYLNWDQVREMSQSGLIEFGSHTVSHPILTRITPEEARIEIEDSKKRIEQEIGKPVISLAYPNGGAADFSPEVISAAKDAGIEIAFTLLAGPTRYRSVKESPFEIRRIFLIYNDNFSRFIMKISGLARLFKR